MIKKILVVDDDESVLELIDAVFKYEDYEVICARDGQQALKVAQAEHPSIIILDIFLPKLNGYEVCKSVKTDPPLSDTKVLMLSGMTQKGDLQKANEAGADDYIFKPFDPTKLIERVKVLTGSI